jgi:hypothetical protein
MADLFLFNDGNIDKFREDTRRIIELAQAGKLS